MDAPWKRYEDMDMSDPKEAAKLVKEADSGTDDKRETFEVYKKMLYSVQDMPKTLAACTKKMKDVVLEETTGDEDEVWRRTAKGLRKMSMEKERLAVAVKREAAMRLHEALGDMEQESDIGTDTDSVAKELGREYEEAEAATPPRKETKKPKAAKKPEPADTGKRTTRSGKKAEAKRDPVVEELSGENSEESEVEDVKAPEAEALVGLKSPRQKQCPERYVKK
jgi:hypothetical protein